MRHLRRGLPRVRQKPTLLHDRVMTTHPPRPTAASSNGSESAPGADLAPKILAPDQGQPRMMSLIVLLLGLGIFLALPFVLSELSVVFLPVCAALVLSIALWPFADWLANLRVPNIVASLLSVLLLLVVMVVGVFLVLQPAISMVDDFPALSAHILNRLEPLLGDVRQIGTVTDQINRAGGGVAPREVVLATPSWLEQMAWATPGVVFQLLMALILTLFMLEGRMRAKRRLLLDRMDFQDTLRAARAFSDVQASISTYFGTTVGIALALGCVVALGAFMFDLEYPVMWGGLAALLNLVPYIGPLVMALLLAMVGLGTEGSLAGALAPACAYLVVNAIEANLVTPIVVGKRLALSPAAVLIAITYFGWIWGLVGVILSVPLLLIVNVVMHHIGKPNIIGFVFGEPLFRPRETPIDQAG